jgi:ribosomal protein S1
MTLQEYADKIGKSVQEASKLIEREYGHVVNHPNEKVLEWGVVGRNGKNSTGKKKECGLSTKELIRNYEQIPIIESDENETIGVVKDKMSEKIVVDEVNGERRFFLDPTDFPSLNHIVKGNIVALKADNGRPEVLYVSSKDDWQRYKIQDSYCQRKTVLAKVLYPCKDNGNYFVNVFGWKALLYANQIPQESKIGKGKSVKVLITKVECKEGNLNFVSVSMTKALGKESFMRKGERDFDELQIGAVKDCIVDKVESNRIFVRFDSLYGVINMPDLLWSKVFQLEKYFNIGEPIQAKVIEKRITDDGKFFVKLSHKECLCNLWKLGVEIGDEVECTVIGTNKDGVILSIAKGLEGFMYKRDMTHHEYVNFQEWEKSDGDARVIVKSFNPEQKSLIFHTTPYRDDKWWSEIKKEYREGKAYEAYIFEVERNGIWVDLDNMLEAYVPGNEIYWKNAMDETEYETGQSVNVQLLHLDEYNHRAEVSIRQLKPNPWELAEKDLEGKILEVRVGIYRDDDIVVETTDSLHLLGRIRKSEVSWFYTKENLPKEMIPAIGEIVEAKVIIFRRNRCQLEFSIRQINEDPWSNVEEGNDVLGIIQNPNLDGGQEILLENGLKAISFDHESRESIGEKRMYKVMKINRIAKQIIVSHSQYVQEKVLDGVIQCFFKSNSK